MRANTATKLGDETGWGKRHGIWSDRLSGFARLCEERAAEADEASHLSPAVTTALREAGILVAPLPPDHAGQGLLQSSQWLLLHEALRAFGAADLSIGRLFEGHCNAIELVRRYGTSRQFEDLAAGIRRGAMTGVWGADGNKPLCIKRHEGRWQLEGGKILASGSGFLLKPLVTASSEEGQRIVLLDLEGEDARIDLSRWTPQGMRSSATGSVDLSGIVIGDDNLIGEPGDFMRQPYFSGGAWRFCAVHLGAIERLVDLFIAQLRARRRDEDPYQLQRVATCITAARSTAYWTKAAARHLALSSHDAESCVALSNLTRGVTERAALDVMEVIQRGIGLASFMRPGPIERISRDLRTYLRQPVPDLAMADAARFALAAEVPVRDMWTADAN
ncbi:acyl-CoA dehydrogenase family protein [Labrys portucalensis]|uniref:Acyl-CoA dehydrogenase family protein n=1 Tax=Labrys neptuniae TaxID=376174 RepID=A0ABV6ZQF3_9HYPH